MALIVFYAAPAFRSCALVCVMLAACWPRAVIQGSETVRPRAEKANIKFKLGALFDVRARHLVDAFQLAVESHNSEGLHPHRTARDPEDVHLPDRPPDDVIHIIFEPVITFVDVTDSFAVSNAMCDLISHDVIAIVGITNASSLPTIQSYSATFHVPFLSLGSSQNVTSSAPFQLSLRPPVMAGVVDVLHHQGCSSALYMYDSDEGLMRIQDLFQAINIRELYLELDVRRIGDRAHVTEISKIIGSLHPRREICLVLDVERLDAKGVISVVDGGAPTVKDVILVTLDAEMALNSLLQDPENRPSGFNISGLQLVPSLQPSTFLPLHPHLHPSPSPHRWSPPLTSKGEHRVRGQLNRELAQNQYGHLSSVSLRDGDKDSSRQKQAFHSNHDAVSDSRHGHRSGSPSKSGDQQYRSGSNSDKPKHHRPEVGSSSEESENHLHPSDWDPNSHEHPHHQHRSEFDSSYEGPSASFVSKPADAEPHAEGVEASSRSPVVRSCEALIVDCLKVLTVALADLWDTLGDVLESSSEASQEDMSIKCTNFVVEKKQYGADLMEALRLVHIHGETRYISFDTGGKREDYTLSVLSVRAGSSVIRTEGEWSSVTGLTSQAWARDGVRSYTIFGNVSGHAGRRVLLGVAE